MAATAEARHAPRASFSDLPAGLVTDILRHLDLEGQGRTACVSRLCAAAAQPLAPALAHYVTAGDAPAVWRLLQKPGARLGLDYPSCEDSLTPLLAAVDRGSLEILAALLDAGAATEVPDIYGSTALIMAAEQGHTVMVMLLLEAGAVLEAEAKYGMRALHCTARYGRASTVAALLAAGAALEAETKHGWRALHCAAMVGRASTVEALLAAGAVLEAEDRVGWQALHWAAANGHVSALEKLIAAGADLAAVTKNGESWLQLAESRGHPGAVAAISASGGREGGNLRNPFVSVPRLAKDRRGLGLMCIEKKVTFRTILLHSRDVAGARIPILCSLHCKLLSPCLGNAAKSGRARAGH